MEGLIAGLVVGVLAILGQVWQRHQDAQIRRDEKLEDWARQDAVAAQAAQAAELLLREQRETKSRTDEVAVVAAHAAAKVEVQLGELRAQSADIHDLVNSDMTFARQELLDQTRMLLSLYRRAVEADVEAGREPLEADLQAIKDAEERVQQLRGILADRLAQQALVEERHAARSETSQ